MDSDKNPLTNKYQLDDEDPDLIQWRQVVDLDSAAKLEHDWYSTQTYEAFLDALDINQPSVNRDKSESAKSLNKNISPLRTDTGSLNSDCKSPKLVPERKQQLDSPTAETILSAEALKILSELPDLSQMSATRSFIFPQQQDRNDRKKRTR